MVAIASYERSRRALISAEARLAMLSVYKMASLVNLTDETPKGLAI